MNWYKKAENTQDKRQIILQGASFVANIIQQALSQNPTTPSELRTIILSIAKQNGILDGGRIKFPKNINPEQNLYIKIYPQSQDGVTNAEVQGDCISLYTSAILKNPQYAVQEIYGRLAHELAHIFEEKGTEPNEEVEDAGERTVRYLTNSGEINSNAWQIASLYSQLFPNKPLDIAKLNQLAQQYSHNGTIQIYLVKFLLPEIQKKYAHIIDVKQVNQNIVNKIKNYVDYIIQQNQPKTAYNKTWYKKAQNDQKIDWEKIHGNLDHHMQEILSGKKPAGHFIVSWNNGIIDYATYPKIFDYIKQIKETRPDIKILHLLTMNKDGDDTNVYIIGKPDAVQSILEGQKRLVYNGFSDLEGHRMFGKGVGYTPKEIDKFINELEPEDQQLKNLGIDSEEIRKPSKTIEPYVKVEEI